MYYKRTVQNFLNVLKKELSKENFDVVMKNIGNVKMKYEKNQSDSSGLGHYDHTGIIVIHDKKDDITLYHELFHASSSYHNESVEEVFSGFHSQQPNLKRNIGLGLNEGYTELLTERYFGKYEDSGYKNEMHYAKLLEHIVGSSIMQTLYFNHDVNSLIVELTKYNSLKNALKFLDDLDTFIILDELTKDKMKSINDIPFVEYTKWFEERNNHIKLIYFFFFFFFIESYLNKIHDDIDFESKKSELISMMSVPLSYNGVEYSVDASMEITDHLNSKKQI